jgi:hypothetical protein
VLDPLDADLAPAGARKVGMLAAVRGGRSGGEAGAAMTWRRRVAGAEEKPKWLWRDAEL